MSYDVDAVAGRIADASGFLADVRTEMAKAIVGQRYMVERFLLALICDGHVLVEGVPGLAKTTAVKALARTLRLGFARVQFTPDLLPSDLVGTLVYRQETAEFIPKTGPIFTNVLLGDEINRAPAKVQSALLEAMQERQVTIGEATHPLPWPFLVLATQNPIEQEGTYPLPEAPVDRFMLKLALDYPSRDEESEIIERHSFPLVDEPRPVCGADEIRRARALLPSVYMDPKVVGYILDIVAATREPAEAGIKDLELLIEYGASPRASIHLALASRGEAFIRGRGYVLPEDVKEVAPDVLRHRVILSYEAEAEEVSADDVISRILARVPVP